MKHNFKVGDAVRIKSKSTGLELDEFLLEAGEYLDEPFAMGKTTLYITRIYSNKYVELYYEKEDEWDNAWNFLITDLVVPVTNLFETEE